MEHALYASQEKTMHLKFQCALSPDDDVLVETLLGIVRQLESQLGAQHPTTEKLGPQHLQQRPEGSVHSEDLEPSSKIKNRADLPKQKAQNYRTMLCHQELIRGKNEKWRQGKPGHCNQHQNVSLQLTSQPAGSYILITESRPEPKTFLYDAFDRNWVNSRFGSF